MPATATADDGNSRRILPPQNFPVRWDPPEDEQLLWTHEAEHGAPVLLPADEAMSRWVGSGLAHAIRLYGGPVRGVRGRRINTYWYSAMVPDPMPPDQMKALHDAGEALRAERSRMVADLWRDTWHPEVQESLRYWSAADVRAMDDRALAAHLRGAEAPGRRLWEIHFELVFCLFPVISQFQEMCHDLFGDDPDPILGHELVVGEENASVLTARALWKLSRAALATPEILPALAQPDPRDVVAELSRTDAGRRFWARFTDFLSEWGRRSDQSREGLGANWDDDPTLPLSMLRAYLAAPDGDPDAELAARRVRRDARTAEARARLQDYPATVRDEFEDLLRRARFASQLAEDHNFHLDQKCAYWHRHSIAEAGRRLTAAGLLADPRDAAFLSVEEIVQALEGGEPTPGALQEKAAYERSELVRWAAVEPPARLGTEPPEGHGPPAEPAAPPSPPLEPGLLVGVAASPGTVRARARVAHSLAEATAVEPGEVLVTTTTNPMWAPLFPVLGGLVTTVGSALSHGAIVAREFGIPAVVAVSDATKRIQTGQWLEVDGSSGRVRVLENAPPSGPPGSP